MSKQTFTYLVQAEQDHTPVRGNAMASGDDADDRECEDEIIRRLDSGDVWAWASVRVTARCECCWQDGHDYLGACSYEDESDFRKGGYFDDMCSQAAKAIEHAPCCKDEAT